MNRLQFKIVRELFHELSEMPSEDQARILSERELDPLVRKEVEMLLEASESTDATKSTEAFEEEQLGALGSALVSCKLDDYEREEPLPESIGPYRVLRKLGAGGMGLVYAARHEDTDELCAVKVIRPSVDSGSFLQRFGREVRNLRRLRHEGIAAFHAEGTATIETDTGRTTLPYLAMELVDGVPLNQYAADHQLGDRERVELVALVCDALQHAHEKNIVHRDLKPTNILVVGNPGKDGVGQPKLLDFGIARAIDGDAQTMTLTTAGILMGTLPYMSPEQVGSNRASTDARSDVYGLGVILYELLAGRLPYPVRGQPIPYATRMILEEEPTRLGSVVRRLRGDLEVIVSKTLEKNPGHRYPSAAALAADLRRYLASDAIHARSPALFTRAIRFTRRYKAQAAGALALFSSLFVALVVTAYFGVKASERAEENLAMVYRTSMRAAALAHSVGDLIEVREHLRDAPAELRGWEWELLDASMDDSLAVRPLGFDEDLLELRFAPTGSELVLLSQDMDASAFTVRILDAHSGETLAKRRLVGGDSIGLSANGEWLVRQSSAGHVSYERAMDGALRVGLGEHELGDVGRPIVSNTGRALVHIPGGRRYLSATDDGTLQLHDLIGGLNPSISPDGLRVAYWSSEGLALWDPVGGLRKSVEPTTEGWTALGPQPQWVCLVPTTGTEIEVWRDDGVRPLRRDSRLVGHSRKIKSIAFSGDGCLLASGGADQSIRIWNLETGESLATRVGHSDLVDGLAFSPDGKRLVSIGKDSTLRWWSTAEDARVLQHDDYVYGVCFSPDGARIYTASWDTYLRVYDTASGAEIAKWREASPVRDVTVGPTGEWVAGSTGGSVAVFDTRIGQELARFEFDQRGRLGLAASPVDDVVAIVNGRKGELLLLDVFAGEFVASRPLQTQRGKVAFAYSSDGSLIAVLQKGRGCLLLDSQSLEIVREIRIDADSAVAFSPDGRELAIGTEGWKIRLVRLDSRADEVVLEGHTAVVHALRYTSDGRCLVSGSSDNTLGIWDRERGELFARFWGHEEYVYDLDVTGDGERILTASGDGTARIWEPYPLAQRLGALEDRESQVKRLRPLIRERMERDGARATAEALQSPDPDSGPRERELALQVLLQLCLED